MPMAGGRLVLTGSGEQYVFTGFSPDLLLFFYTNTAVEDTFELSAGVAGFGVGNRSNGLPGTVETVPPCATTHELWSGNKPTSDYRNDLSTWVRATPGGGGYALGIRRIEVDGFTLDYAGGFAGGAGRIIYWFVIGEEPDLESKNDYFTRVHSSLNTVFQPGVGFSVGHGGPTSGGSGGGGASYGSVIADIGTWAVSSVFDELGIPSSVRSIYMCRAIREASGSNAVFDSINATLPPEESQLYADEYLTGTGFSFGMFTHGSTASTYTAPHGHPGVGFVADDGRIYTAAVGGLVGYGGSVTPSATVGGEVEVVLPLEVEAVIFFSPSFRDSGGIANDVVFGTGFGFMTNNYQAVVCAGGHFNTGMIRYQSGSQSWVSNFTGGTIDGSASYGTSQITNNGFKLVTTANGKPMESIMYMALGFPARGQQFFRRLGG